VKALAERESLGGGAGCVGGRRRGASRPKARAPMIATCTTGVEAPQPDGDRNFAQRSSELDHGRQQPGEAAGRLVGAGGSGPDLSTAASGYPATHTDAEKKPATIGFRVESKVRSV
jgi:hypothetical protein